MVALRSDDDGALLRVLFGVIAADELEADEGITSVREAYRELTGHTLSDQQIADARARAGSDSGAWLEAARALAPTLDAEGRHRVLDAAFAVAMADGFVLDEEDRVLATLAAALGMNEHEYRQSVDKLLPR